MPTDKASYKGSPRHGKGSTSSQAGKDLRNPTKESAPPMETGKIKKKVRRYSGQGGRR